MKRLREILKIDLEKIKNFNGNNGKAPIDFLVEITSKNMFVQHFGR